MNTKPCAFCGKPAPQVEGRKPRKYCSNTCRQKDWQATNKKVEPKTEEKKEEKKADTADSDKEFMGHPIPEGLSGIPLAVWKNNIKMAKKK